MAEYDSLVAALENWFDKPWADLPEDERERIKRDFFPLSWEMLSPRQRGEMSSQHDYQHDPAYEGERNHIWALFSEREKIKHEITDWESKAAPTVLDKVVKNERLKSLRERD